MRHADRQPEAIGMFVVHGALAFSPNCADG